MKIKTPTDVRRVARKCTIDALVAIDMIGRCAQHRSYKLNEFEVERIAEALHKAVRDLESDLNGALYESKPITFTLREGDNDVRRA